MTDLKFERQQHRLKYLELCALVLGEVNRKNIMDRFGVQVAYASRDINEYQTISGHKLNYDTRLKSYRPVDWFLPHFCHDTEDAIDLLSNWSPSLHGQAKMVVVGLGNRTELIKNMPDLLSVAPVIRALHLKTKVEIVYISRTSGETNRMISPHSLIRTGSFIYVRAFDQLSGEFRSFKLNRIKHSRQIQISPAESEIEASDLDWTTEIQVTFGLNDGVQGRAAIAFDYGLENDERTVTLRKAVVPYFLMDWNIAPLEHPHLPPVLFPLKVVSICVKN